MSLLISVYYIYSGAGFLLPIHIIGRLAFCWVLFSYCRLSTNSLKSISRSRDIIELRLEGILLMHDK